MSFTYRPVKLSTFQRALTIPYFSINALVNPTRADMVAGLGDTSGYNSLKRIKNCLEKTSSGTKLLKDRPLISFTTSQMEGLSKQVDGTLGKEYADFMGTHGFNANERPSVKFIEDPELAYIMLRYRQVHDFWHVLVDLPPSVLGEIALKWFEWKTTGLPVCALSSLVGPLRLSSGDKKLLISVYIPWTLQSTVDCGELLSFRYEDSMHLPLTDIRQSLRITPAPTLLSH